MHFDYWKAIEALQTTLRTDPDDISTLLWLGEAYMLIGRYPSALKALERVQVLRPRDWISMYLIGKVKIELGQYNDAVMSYKHALSERPDDPIVVSSLAQAHLELGREELRLGLVSRGVLSFAACITISLLSINTTRSFQSLFWKTIGDAFLCLSSISSYTEETILCELHGRVLEFIKTPSSHLSSLPTLKLPPKSTPVCSISFLHLAIWVYDHRLSLSLSDIAVDNAWFDLGVALRYWAQTTIHSDSNRLAIDKAQECIGEAIRVAPRNEHYWAALGDANFVNGRGKFAQHAYIRTLEIQPKVGIRYFSSI